MKTLEERRRRLNRAFPADQADVLAEVITDAYDDLVKVSDFTELKEVVADLGRGLHALRGTVADLAEAQKRTEHGLEDLSGVVRELAQAQAETSKEVRELAQAQAETSKEVRELAQAQVETSKEVRELAVALRGTRRDVGGLTQSMGYAMENEAYRMLPPVLEERLGIALEHRLLRTQIGDQEINVFGEGTRDGQAVVVVGEVKVRLDARWRKDDPTIFEELEAKAEVVRQAYPDREVVLVIVTHFARPGFLEEAKKRGVAVIQSFEW